MATYPTAVRSFTNKVDGVDYFYASDLNSAYDEITAVESTLGVNPSVSLASTAGTFNAGTGVDYGTVKSRLDNVELGLINGATHAVQTTGGSVIQSTTTSVVSLTLQALAGQAVDLFAMKDSVGTVRGVKVDKDFGTQIGPGANGNVKPLVVKGMSGQTVNFFEVQDSNSVVKAKVDINGFMTAGSFTAIPAVDSNLLFGTAFASGTQDLIRILASDSVTTKFKVDNKGQIWSAGGQVPYRTQINQFTVSIPANATSGSATLTTTGFSSPPFLFFNLGQAGFISYTASAINTFTVTVTVPAVLNAAAATDVTFTYIAIQGAQLGSQL